MSGCDLDNWHTLGLPCTHLRAAAHQIIFGGVHDDAIEATHNCIGMQVQFRLTAQG
jgi:hypothetical protein